MEIDLGRYCKERSTRRAEELFNGDKDRFRAYLCMVKNERRELADSVSRAVTRGTKADSEQWMKQTLSYLPRDHSTPQLTDIALVSVALTEFGIGHLDELYRDGRMRHYKDIPLTSNALRHLSRQQKHRDESRSAQKEGKDVAHYGGLDLVTQLNMELAPRFRADTEFLREFLNRDANFRIVLANTNRSLHKNVDTALVARDAVAAATRTAQDRILQIVLFFQRPEHQREMLENGGKRLYAKVREAVRAINGSLWDMRHDMAELR